MATMWQKVGEDSTSRLGPFYLRTFHARSHSLVLRSGKPPCPWKLRVVPIQHPNIPEIENYYFEPYFCCILLSKNDKMGPFYMNTHISSVAHLIHSMYVCVRLRAYLHIVLRADVVHVLYMPRADTQCPLLVLASVSNSSSLKTQELTPKLWA